jgi:hypothetical protein
MDNFTINNKQMKLTGFSLILLLMSGCGLRQKEEQLLKKEVALNQREQELLLKEKTLKIKEQELLLKEKKIDSTGQTDTTMLFNPAIIGMWNVTMICTETTCAGSAVGDTRTEQWNISYESNAAIIKAMADDKLVRTYIGAPNRNTIELKDQQTTDSSSTKMTVRLRLINATTMDGEREIIRENNCKVVYSLQLKK